MGRPRQRLSGAGRSEGVAARWRHVHVTRPHAEAVWALQLFRNLGVLPLDTSQNLHLEQYKLGSKHFLNQEDQVLLNFSLRQGGVMRDCLGVEANMPACGSSLLVVHKHLRCCHGH